MSSWFNRWVLVMPVMSSLALAASAATVSIDTGAGKTVSKVWNIDVEQTVDGKPVFNGDDLQWLAGTGEPRLPWAVTTVLLPPDADPAGITCRLQIAEYEPLDGTWQVDPQPLRATRDPNGNEIILSPPGVNLVEGYDAAIYTASAFWPGQQARLLDVGQMHKWRMAKVAVPLVLYNPVTGELSKLVKADVILSYGRVAVTPELDAAIKRPDPAGSARARAAAINYDQDAAAYDGASSLNGTIQPAGLTSTGYYILTTAAIQSASTKLAAFVTHKTTQGYNVQVKTESTWGGGTGDTAATNIRNWLKANYVNLQIKYVLLIGDPNQTSAVPMKLCGTGEGAPTDYFYTDLSGNWDLNGNGVYGEQSDLGAGGIDRYWEVIAARIPYYGSIADLDAILQKTINYETAADKTWRRRVLLPHVPLDNVTPSFQLGELIKNDVLAPQGIPYHRIYNEDFTASPPPETIPNTSLGTTRVWSATPFGLVIWMTHGWSGGGSAVMDTGWVPYLNDSYPSATYQGSCSNSYPEDTNNIAYALLRQGGINTIGGTRMTWYYIGETYFVGSPSIGGIGYEYAKRIVGNPPTTAPMTPGEAFVDLVQNLPADGWGNFMLMNIYGDPSIQVVPPAAPEFRVCGTDRYYTMGNTGGPFTWSSKTYTLKNTYSTAINWTANTAASWLSISPTNGSLAANASVNVTVSTASSATTMLDGTYNGTIVFTDTSHSKSVTRNATLDIQPKQMVGYWKLDDAAGTTAVDSSGSTNPASLGGGMVFGDNSVTGHFGNGLNLDGVDDYLAVPNLRLCGDSVTFTAWIKRNGDQPAYAGIIFNRYNSACAGLDFGNGNNLLSYAWEGGVWSSNRTVPDGVWVFVALVVKPTQAKLYLYDTSLHTWTRNATHGLQYFGAGTCIGVDPVGEANRFFKGAIDDVRVYDYALDDNSILAIATGAGKATNAKPEAGCLTVPATANLYWTPSLNATAHDIYFGTSYSAVLAANTSSPQYQGRQATIPHNPTMTSGATYYWRVDEVVGTQVTKGDVWWFNTSSTPLESGMKFRGTMDTVHISGTTLINAAGPPAYNGRIYGNPANPAGRIGQALTFDGVDDCVRIPAMNLGSNTVTLTAWVKRNGNQSSYTGIIYSRAGNTVAGLHFGDANDLVYTWNDDGNTWTRSSGLIVPDNQWVLTALVVEPSKATLYLGAGGEVGSWVNLNWHDAEEFNGYTYIGWDPCDSARRLKGGVDDVGIWNRALTLEEIQTLYDVGAGGASLANKIVTDLAAVTVPEGGTATLRVKLDQQPSGNITVNTAHVDGSDKITVQSGASLLFTSSNWGTYQTVTLAAARDTDMEDDLATVRCSADGLADVDVTVNQNDTVAGDFDADGDVDMEDFGHLQWCLTGTGVAVTEPTCFNADLDKNSWIDEVDLLGFISYFNGPGQPPKTP